MSIWWVLWLGLSAALMYFFAWTFYILQRQKKNWARWAQAKSLRYVPGGLSDSPGMSGTIDGMTISYFTGEHDDPAARSSRKMTAIEINLSSRMPVDAAAASGGMVTLVRDLSFREELPVDNERWAGQRIVMTDDRVLMKQYLTDSRLEALGRLMDIKSAWVILIFRNNMALLRIDTPDPLDREETLRRYTTRMIETARLLELVPGELERLKSDLARRETAHVKLEEAEEGSGGDIRFEDDSG